MAMLVVLARVQEMYQLGQSSSQMLATPCDSFNLHCQRCFQVNFAAETELQCISNYNILQQAIASIQHEPLHQVSSVSLLPSLTNWSIS